MVRFLTLVTLGSARAPNGRSAADRAGALGRTGSGMTDGAMRAWSGSSRVRSRRGLSDW
ncbi:hypothetical protein GCM10011428_70920 [Streptomyces violaceus]